MVTKQDNNILLGVIIVLRCQAYRDQIVIADERLDDLIISTSHGALNREGLSSTVPQRCMGPHWSLYATTRGRRIGYRPV